LVDDDLWFCVDQWVGRQIFRSLCPEKVILISGIISVVAIAITSLALYRLEGVDLENKIINTNQKVPFKTALKEILTDPDTKRFTIFIFLSMLAFSAQDLILEPFAGIIFKYDLRRDN
jgi:BCD family chlorophyll transporter-like MFS transporter